jgi:hypothetical protein
MGDNGLSADTGRVPCVVICTVLASTAATGSVGSECQLDSESRELVVGCELVMPAYCCSPGATLGRLPRTKEPLVVFTEP